MCEFKFCRGSSTCFLSKTSPCTGFEASQPRRDRPRSIRMRYEGFLDQDELLAVLEPANASVQENDGHDANDHLETIGKLVEEDKARRKSKVRPAPRFLSANSANASDRKNSAA